MTLNASFELSSAMIKSSVNSYPTSLKFLKKFIPISISSLIFSRLEVDEDSFHKCKYYRCDYYVLKKTTKDPQLINIFDSLHGIIEALEKKYLREVRLIILDKKGENILEEYKYTITYNESGEGITVVETKKLKKNIYNTIKSHLGDIKDLSAIPKVPQNFEFYIMLTYYEKVTPFDYQPLGFEDGKNKSHIWKLSRKNMLSLPIQKLTTGYHSIHCSARISEIQEEEENSKIIECEIENREDQQNDETSNISNRNEDTLISNPLTRSLDESSIEKNFNCLCGINDDIEDIENVSCTICKLTYHKPCAFMFMPSTFSLVFVCIDCAENNSNIEASNYVLADYKKEGRELIVSRLFLLELILKYNTYPESVISKLSQPKRKNFEIFLFSGQFCSIDETTGDVNLNMSKIKEYVKHDKNMLFSQSQNSMQLPDSEPPFPKKRKHNCL